MTTPPGSHLMPWPARVVLFVRNWRAYLMEASYSLLSAFLAFTLMRDDLTPQTNPPIYGALELIRMDPDQFGLIAAAAATLKIVGLFVCLVDGASRAGALLRLAGLGMSGFLWIALGLTIYLRNPLAITWLPLCFLGAQAAGAMIAYPAMPPRRVP